MSMEIEQALTVFVEGFCFTRSLTHPYLAQRREKNLWRLSDAPRRRASDTYRGEEWIAWELSPAVVDAQARATAQSKFTVCYLVPLGESDTQVRAAFKALGYRLMSTEPLMVQDLTELPDFPRSERFPIVPVQTSEQADTLAEAARRKMLLPEHLTADPPPIRLYLAQDEAVPQVVGWVGSAITSVGTWVTSLFVEKAYRRQGVGRALMARMLADDKASGAPASVLLASHTGALLYPTLGYQQLGSLYLYTPPRR